MENINIKDIGNGYVRLTAKKGYNLYSVRLARAVSEAVVKREQVREFEARSNG